MLSSEKEFLFQFGWDDCFESQISSPVSSSLFLARIICEERILYCVQAGLSQIFWASVRGKVQFNAAARAHYPAVGDWIMVELPGQFDRGVNHQVLQRKTIVHRKQVGSSADMQILSTQEIGDLLPKIGFVDEGIAALSVVQINPKTDCLEFHIWGSCEKFCEMEEWNDSLNEGVSC